MMDVYEENNFYPANAKVITFGSRILIETLVMDIGVAFNPDSSWLSTYDHNYRGWLNFKNFFLQPKFALHYNFP